MGQASRRKRERRLGAGEGGVRPVTKLDAMPACVGHHLAAGRCGLRPVNFVLGIEPMDGDLVLVYAAACPLHLEAVRDYLSTPLGAFTAPYEAQVLRDVQAGLDGEYSAAWELVPASAAS